MTLALRAQRSRCAHSHRPHARVAVSLLTVALLAASCATDLPGSPPELDTLEFPVGIALHPDGRYLYVVNANFNLKFRPQDGGTLVVVDLETGALIEAATRTLASFATDIVLNHDASRGYIAARGDSSITWFALDADGASPQCPLSSDDRNLDECTFGVPAEPTALAYTRSSRTTPLLDEQGNPILDEQGNPREVVQDFDLLGVAHLRDGLVSAVTITDAGPAAEPAFSIASAALVDGPSAIAVQDGERFFVTGRVANAVVGWRPAIGPDARVLGLFVDSVLPVPTPFNAIQGRALLFSADRDRLFLTNQSPNSLLVFDTSEADNDAVSGRQNRIIHEADLPRGPDKMAWVDAPGGERLLYITAFDEDRVLVVDPTGPTVIWEFPVGDGPFALVVDQQHRQQAYVSNFAENSISVIDISDPLRPFEIGVIAGDSIKER